MNNKRISVATVIIGVFSVIALVGGIVFFIAGQNQGSGGAASEEAGGGSSEGPAESAAAATGTEESVCGLNSYSASNDLETTAPETKWEWVDGFFMIAHDGTHGPGIIEENGLRHCYSRTPTGVLYAMYNYANLGSLMAPSDLADSLIPSPMRDEMLMVTTPTPGPPEDLEPVGFRLLNYDGSNVVVEFVYDVRGAFVAGKVQARWYEGDWRRVPLAHNELIYDVHEVDNLAGYVPWGPRQ